MGFSPFETFLSTAALKLILFGREIQVSSHRTQRSGGNPDETSFIYLMKLVSLMFDNYDLQTTKNISPM